MTNKSTVTLDDSKMNRSMRKYFNYSFFIKDVLTDQWGQSHLIQDSHSANPQQFSYFSDTKKASHGAIIWWRRRELNLYFN